MSTCKDTQEDVVTALLAHRIPVSQICRYLRITLEQYKNDYSHLDHSDTCIDQNQAVENSIFEMAVRGNHQCATFWMKNKALWDDGKTAREQANKEAEKDSFIERIEIVTIANKKKNGEDS